MLNATDLFVQFLHDKLEVLHRRWDQMGMPDQMRGDRANAVYDNLRDMLDQMVGPGPRYHPYLGTGNPPKHFQRTKPGAPKNFWVLPPPPKRRPQI